MSRTGPRERKYLKFHSELKMFPVNDPTIVYEDNPLQFRCQKIWVSPTRGRNISISFKQSVELGEIIPEYVPTEEQAADMLTKTLPPAKFIYFREKVMGDSASQSHFEKK